MLNNQLSLTLKAEEDIRNIWLHIAKDNINAAEKLANDFEAAFFKLSDYPNMGSKRDDLTDLPVRF